MLKPKPPYCSPCGTKSRAEDEHKGTKTYAVLSSTVRHDSTSGTNVDDKPPPPHTVAELAHELDHYEEVVRSQARRILDFEHKMHEQKEMIESLHAQKDQIIDEFCILRHKYDDVKAHLCEVLWGVLPSGYIPGVEGKGTGKLEGIPLLTHDIVESSTRIGGYEIREVLGEGQFASVRAIRPWSRSDMDKSFDMKIKNDLEKGKSGVSSPPERAVKMINKADVVSLTTLRRVDNEIDVLRLLKHEGVMKLHEVIHAPACLYMVTDRAGRDLFEFFDEHLEGISEDAACLLMHKIITPLHYCHSMGVVHRDLKPENVLFADKKPLTAATRVVLCDFGLCARVGTPGIETDTEIDKNVLREFCGSPGFFAPEMLIEGEYDGRKDCAAFDTSIRQAVMDLRQELPLHVSPALCCLLLEALDLDRKTRPTLAALLQHDLIMQSGSTTTGAEQTDVLMYPNQNLRKRGDLTKVVPDSTSDTINPQQDYESLCGHRARSPPLPASTRGSSTSLRRAKGKGDRDLSPQRERGRERGGDTQYHYIYRNNVGTDSPLEADDVIDATPVAAQLQTIGDRYWRALAVRQRRIQTLPDTPTILGTQRVRIVLQERLLPITGSTVRDTLYNHQAPRKAWLLDDSKIAIPPADIVKRFFGNRAATTASFEGRLEGRKTKYFRTMRSVDAKYAKYVEEKGVHLNSNRRGEGDSTTEDDLEASSVKTLFPFSK